MVTIENNVLKLKFKHKNNTYIIRKKTKQDSSAIHRICTDKKD
jgi:hypothetical protein